MVSNWTWILSNAPSWYCALICVKLYPANYFPIYYFDLIWLITVSVYGFMQGAISPHESFVWRMYIFIQITIFLITMSAWRSLKWNTQSTRLGFCCRHLANALVQSDLPRLCMKGSLIQLVNKTFRITQIFFFFTFTATQSRLRDPVSQSKWNFWMRNSWIILPGTMQNNGACPK